MRTRQTIRPSLCMPYWRIKWKAWTAVTGLLAILVIGIGYEQLSTYVDGKLANAGLGSNTALFSAPRIVNVGDESSTAELAQQLRAAGYSEDGGNSIGSMHVAPNSIEIRPGRDSYFREDAIRVDFASGRISGITTAKGSRAVEEYALEPQVIATIEDGSLARRKPATYKEIPRVLVDALLSAEDKHFFHHSGFDPLRIAKAAWVNFRAGRKEQGGSTLTMQLSRNLFLDSNKTWRRKLQEALISVVLEIRLSKQEILERYMNQVYLGRRNTLGLHGFGQASETYFNKELSKLSLPEAALLAGLVQRPSYFDPVRHPDRATARRNLVLALMRQNDYINDSQYRAACESPIGIAPRSPTRGDAPWFLEMAMDELQAKDAKMSNARIYTTLDAGLQRDALEAVRMGLKEVDERVKNRRGAPPEVALVAIDSHTGEVKAVVGGRNFGMNQVNHVTAPRQPGSAFKPFVYAAALSDNTIGGGYTPATTVTDEPATFYFDGQPYRPSNFGDRFYGRTTLRRALAHSMNVAAVSVAQKVGYRKVLNLARNAGFGENMRATPSLALGSYEATPLAVAGAYTVFANHGEYAQPGFVSEVRSEDGQIAYHSSTSTRQVLDPRVAFLMQDMLVEVLRSGTAASVRSRGFNIPAAGKTGTSRDGWFAGFTSNLICVVWVGYDDNRDLDLEGAKSALPIWTEFMKRAGHRAAHHQNLSTAPDGIISVEIDSETGQLAGPDCPYRHQEFFIEGTEPTTLCSHNDLLLEPVLPQIDFGAMLTNASYSLPEKDQQ